jgi:hypothetical protein
MTPQPRREHVHMSSMSHYLKTANGCGGTLHILSVHGSVQLIKCK